MICLRMGKTYTAKTPLGDFKVTILKNPLLSQQAVTSKGILVPYTNLQLNPYPNTQLDLFCSDNFSFQCTALSTWLTNCAVQSSSLHHTMKIKKLLCHKTLWCTNTAASLRERWSMTNSVSSHNLHEQDFTSHLCNLCNLWWLSK